mgnify:CR=1 FL=1
MSTTRSLLYVYLVALLLSPATFQAQSSEILDDIENVLSEEEQLEIEEDADYAEESTDSNRENVEFFGMEFYKGDAGKLAFRFGFNLLVILILVRAIYYPVAKRKDFLFTYFLISTTVFLLCFLLEGVKLKLGFALGLFAVFGIIRYRTDAIPIKEMTYLFIVIGMSVLNALVNKKISYVELLIANGAIILVTYGLEKVWLLRHENFKIILYDNIDLIQAGKREDLINDLEQRTGININRVEIGRIDFLRDTALLKIYFFEDDQLAHYEESA